MGCGVLAGLPNDGLCVLAHLNDVTSYLLQAHGRGSAICATGSGGDGRPELSSLLGAEQAIAQPKQAAIGVSESCVKEDRLVVSSAH